MTSYSDMRFTPAENMHVFLDYKVHCSEPIVAWTLASRWGNMLNLHVVVTMWRPIAGGKIRLIHKNKIRVLHKGGAVCHKLPNEFYAI